MAKQKYTFPEPYCPGCQYHQTVGEAVGRTRYCNGFPKRRKSKRFKRSDPKYKPPKWCPRRISPPVCRIYGFANEDAEMMNWLINRESLKSEGGHERDVYISASPHHYKLRLELPLGLTARQFYDAAQIEPVSNVFSGIGGVKLECGEVIEIDDGLKPCYFYYSGLQVTPLSYFDRSLVQPSGPAPSAKGGGRE